MTLFSGRSRSRNRRAGIVAEVIANNTRKPLWGYHLMVYSLFVRSLAR